MYYQCTSEVHEKVPQNLTVRHRLRWGRVLYLNKEQATVGTVSEAYGLTSKTSQAI